MKKIVLLLAGASMFFACNKGGNFDKPTTFMDSVSYSIGQNLGESFRKDKIGKADSINIDAMLAGIRAGIDSTGMFSREKLDSILGDFAMKLNDQERKKAMKEHDEFIKKMSETEGVKMTSSGLLYKIVKEGAGAKPDANDTVVVDFTVKSSAGKELYSSRPDNADRVSVNMINQGLSEGFPLMSAGSQYEFYVPQHLGYGEQGNPGLQIAPYSALTFTVDLMDVVAMPNK